MTAASSRRGAFLPTPVCSRTRGASTPGNPMEVSPTAARGARTRDLPTEAPFRSTTREHRMLACRRHPGWRQAGRRTAARCRRAGCRRTPVDLGETTWKSLLDPSLSRFYRWLPSKGRNRDPEGVFRMEGDVLHILGLPTSGEAKDFGYLATWDQFHDYRLRLEQKWGTQTFPPRKNQPRDSGLLYHLLLPDRSGPRAWSSRSSSTTPGDTWMLSGTGRPRRSRTCTPHPRGSIRWARRSRCAEGNCSSPRSPSR